MADSLKELLERTESGTISLLPGEYEGPFVIRRPMKICGNHATIWAKHGPVLTVASSGVSIQDLRVEITDAGSTGEMPVSVLLQAADTVVEQVEVVGAVSGAGAEDGAFFVPQMVALGEFPAERECRFLIEVFLPVPSKAYTDLHGVTLSPETLPAGKSTLSVLVAGMREGTFLYGSIFLASRFCRRIYINGAPKGGCVGYQDGRTLHKVEESKLPMCESTLFSPAGAVSMAEGILPFFREGGLFSGTVLKRGQRSALLGFDLTDLCLHLSYQECLREMEIDPYVFLLDQNNHAEEDDRLVFFGNASSKDGAVRLKEYDAHTDIQIDLTRVSPDTARIAVAYAIYGENPNHNFSKVVAPMIQIVSGGEERMRFLPDGLYLEKTVVLVEFYRYKGTWKINTVGAGYQDGLKRLCESYGLTIAE